MSLPFFFQETIDTASKQITLDEDASKHIVQVLRMKAGEELQLTDGRGNVFTTAIIEAHKKHCTVDILRKTTTPPKQKEITIAISLVKNSSRFEWFLEKATEIGISHIVPLICQRTEKQHFRFDRMKGILISAMLQSQQSLLPVLQQPVPFTEFVNKEKSSQKFIAHCEAGMEKQELIAHSSFQQACMLIGPEGDFTREEIAIALQQGFTPVSLGATRLRTETAGMVAAVLMANTRD
jgi:16S rRNA (uracil1498-N3)-methyltransferase